MRLVASDVLHEAGGVLHEAGSHMSTMALVGYEPPSVSNDTTTERLMSTPVYSMRLVAIMRTGCTRHLTTSHLGHMDVANEGLIHHVTIWTRCLDASQRVRVLEAKQHGLPGT